MSLLSFPSTINHCSKTIFNSLPFTSQTSHNFHRFSVHSTSLYTTSSCVVKLSSPFSWQPVIKTSSSSSHRGLSLVSFDAKSDSGSIDHEDHRALDTVLKLYSAIKSQNICELSDIIGEECRCVCNFISFFQPFQGKKQVIDFFSYLIRSLGNNIEFVVKPTLHDGMNVGVAWRLEWRKNHVPLGKGFSFYVCQIYQGRVVIRNVEMFMEPLLHMEPFRIKIMSYVMMVVDKLSSYTMTKDQKRKALLYKSLFLLFFLAVLLLFSKPGLY
ncbi:uncharacterized protein LOC116137652 [Pistacia vera]|uniref:uncharacterized protein LOC116137652 n=1 Tax=Pistacia vera TaxID=55513 RepID=UPI0012638100|nr:uncharacterized protein LOC116137652 [Pistacia vera]